MSMGRNRVLIVEDHRGFRFALGGLFRRVGWDVEAVGTVAEGLAALEPPPGCAAVDLDLPDGDSEALVRRVKEATCVTVIGTGTDDEARIRRAGCPAAQAGHVRGRVRSLRVGRQPLAGPVLS
jgi:DNA-binding response OmpR family regulator